MSRHRPYLIWLAVAVGVTLFVAIALIPGSAWVALDQRRSSLRTTPDGVAAWARSLEALGVPVAQRYDDYETEPPRGRGQAVLEARIPPTAREAHLLLEWVRGGGVLVFSPGFEPLADSLGAVFTLRSDDPFDPVSVRDSLVGHRWTERKVGWESTPTWLMEIERSGPWTALSLRADGSTSLAWIPEGDGGVLIVADGEDLANRTLIDSPIASTVTRAMVDLLAGDTLHFSEYHQGLGGSQGLFRESFGLASGLPVGRVLLHLSAVAAVLLVLSGRRFGAPLPEPPGARRSTVEHVDAVARIFRTARARRTAAHYLVRSAARRMRLPQSAAISEIDLLQSLSRRARLEEPAGTALAALTTDPPDLVTLEAALDTLVARHHSIRPQS